MIRRIINNLFLPVLVGILFLINNIRTVGSAYSLSEIGISVIIVVSITFLVRFLIIKIVTDQYKAEIVSALIIFVTLFYLDIINIFLLTYLSRSDHFFRYFLPLIILLVSLLVYVILRTKRNFKLLTSYLNFIIIIFIGIEVFNWLFFPVADVCLKDNSESPVIKEIKIHTPDVYYIILDEYAGSESLRKYFDYNNVPFEDSLKKIGFFVSSGIKSKYVSTTFCLASYLNYSDLEFESLKIKNDKKVFQLIYNNRIMKIFSGLNYSIVNFSPFDIKNSKKYYDYFPTEHFLGRTIWFQVSPIIEKMFNAGSSIPEVNLKIISQLNEGKFDSPGKPHFIYAHLMMPHEPYYFDSNGKKQMKDIPPQDKYLEQLIFTNNIICETMKKILSNTNNNVIIILQSDHGYRYLNRKNNIENEESSHNIFYSIYLPKGSNTKNFKIDSIEPINTFPVILNTYFDQNINILSEQ